MRQILAVAGFFASCALVTESAAAAIKRQDLIVNAPSTSALDSDVQETAAATATAEVEQPPPVPVTGDCQILHDIWPGFPATGNDCCKAFGISCTDGFITRIRLAYGSPPLQFIPDFSGLTKLILLSLPGKNCQGQFPSLPTTLEYLDLESNRLLSTIPDVTTFPRLRFLSLASNNFTGPVPQLPSTIKSLNLASNHLSGVIPSNLPPSLTSLNLGDNQLTGFIPTNLPISLEYLYLGVNSLIGTIPESIISLTNLNYFNFQDNHLTGMIPPLPENLITNTPPDQLAESLSGNCFSNAEAFGVENSPSCGSIIENPSTTTTPNGELLQLLR
ncbi:L domain-like protein [Rhizoclosmatium globosum]|uniref:L domain-like protein n=1 Tax=Rhizoclosmatium globosum TaxID=329046 RepID=A0A1Y2C5P9_9FUNG|nr:L domain-like protein [Rhizoclosmatium globosum]|eukprot:ORY42204.1 L domain-like protein [Rhizoclosmatium globosum]